MEYIQALTATKAAYRAQVELFKALAHPVRLRILEILAVDESCVCHLTTILGLRQPYISQQLMALRKAGLVLVRRDGVMVYYRLAHPGIADLIELERSVLQSMTGRRLVSAPVPRPPVSGCTCPKCRAAESVGPSG